MAKKAPTKSFPKTAPAVNRFSFDAFSSFVNANFSLIIILVLAFVLGFLSGSLWTENRILKSGTMVADNQAAADEAAAAAAKEKLKQVPAFDPEKDHYRGNKDAKVVLIEYSDFECPFCNRFHPTMLDLMEKYGDEVAWVYRHFPLSFHPNAQPLAEASECVAAYGGAEAFWKFTDSVYEAMGDGSIYGTDSTAKKVSTDMMVSLATTAGANPTSVKACIDNKEMAQKVKDSQAGGSKAGVTGTPGTIIVSKKGGYDLVPGALPLEQVEALLANHL
jgi:protein-disulfide isomerase